jgi:hypothetical protein
MANLDRSTGKNGGAGRNRTDDGGVAVHCITTLLPRLKNLYLTFKTSRWPDNLDYSGFFRRGRILGNISNKSTTYRLY